ncbi:MAG: hypothetical protein AAGA66_14395 [Bacteroidota bacterium]
MTILKNFEDLLETYDAIHLRLQRNGTQRSIIAEVTDQKEIEAEYSYVTDPDYHWAETILYLEVIFRMVEEEARRWSLQKTLGVRIHNKNDEVSLIPLLNSLLLWYVLVPY